MAKAIIASRFPNWLLLLLVGLVPAAASGIDRECGTEPTPANVRAFLERGPLKPLTSPSGGPLCVPIAAHIVRRSDGTGGLTLARLAQGVTDCNTAYAVMGIQFHLLAAIDYIDSDAYFNDIDTGAEIDALRQINPIAGAINVYFTPNLEDEGGGLCGQSSFTTSAVQGIAMSNGCTGTSDNPSTFPHEIGHYFDLFHTHSTAFGAELVDGSNCATAGDLLCDTPADPNLTDLVNDACVYTGSATDSNGDTYVPDPRQYMSYSQKHCRDTFSPQSQARAVATLLASRADHLNCPPVAVAGPEQSVECTSPTTTDVGLDGNGSSDPEGDPLTYAWSAPGVVFDDPASATPTGGFPIGSTEVTLIVTAAGAQDTSTTTVHVVDTTAPNIVCPGDVTVECNSHCGVAADDPQLAAFFAGVSATDACDPDVDISHDAPACFGLGTTPVTFSAEDDDGRIATCVANVTVEDTTPPTISVVLNREALWPPNHVLSPIEASVSVEDACDPSPTFVLTSITSDEPDDGQGDGHTTGDIDGAAIGTADTEFSLRSERDGRQDGRKYTIVYTASDGSGNTASDTACVHVAHDQSGKAHAVLGYTADGRQVDPAATTLAVLIRGTAGRDLRQVDLGHASLGHALGVARPQQVRVSDLDGDGHADLLLSYRAAEVSSLLQEADGQALGLHYTLAGTGVLVGDVFALGAPVDLARSGRRGGSELSIEVPLGGAEPGGTGDGTGSQAAAAEKTAGGRHGVAISTPGRVRVEVYDVLGRKVRTLVDRVLPAGAHDLSWDGTDDAGRRSASGVYFFRIQAPGHQEVRRQVLVR